MGLWKRLFGSKARQSAAPTASQPENIPAGRNAPAPAVSRNFESAFKIGDRIGGRYEVHRILGGGMGVVYVVYDHEARNVLALKTFQNRTAQNSAEQRALERAFEKEASAGSPWMSTPTLSGQRGCKSFMAACSSRWTISRPMSRGRNTLRHYLVGQPVALGANSALGHRILPRHGACLKQRGAVPSGHQAGQHPD